MTTKKSLIIIKYLEVVDKIKVITGKNIFPDFIDAIDIIFYFTYNFMNESEYCQAIDDILEINNIFLDDEVFEKVCDIVIDFIILLKQL
jgi:deoxyhypusine synthase